MIPKLKKGTILARIDQRTPKNVLDQAEADLKLAEVRLENAEAQLTRGEALHAEGSIADQTDRVINIKDGLIESDMRRNV